MKKIFVIAMMVIFSITTSVTVFGSYGYTTNLEALSGITGKTQEDILTERIENKKAYCTIAYESGKLDEYKTAVLKIQKDRIANQVSSGYITQEQADGIIKNIENNQNLCDGLGTCNGLGVCDGYGICNSGMHNESCTSNGTCGEYKVTKTNNGCGHNKSNKSHSQKHGMKIY